MQLPIAQMYHVTIDDQIPYNVYGNRQDGPSFRGPSNSRVFGGTATACPASHAALWHDDQRRRERVGDRLIRVNPNIVWSSGSGAGALGGSVDRVR